MVLEKCRPFSRPSSFLKRHTRNSSSQSNNSSEDDVAANSEYYLGPFVSDIYSQAYAFKQVLNNADVITPSSTVDSSAEPSRASEAFVDLVGRDLTASEQEAAAPFSRLQATRSTWLDGELNEEPATRSLPTTPLPTSTSTTPDADLSFVQPELRRAKTSSDKEPWHLEPEAITELLIDGFGPLAKEGETEQLIFESEGGVSQDVTILVSSPHSLTAVGITI